MKIIREYLESLFLNVPKTPETEKAKQDLLTIMEDHYHALVAEGKSEHEAIGAVISEFGSIDELLDELEIKKADTADTMGDDWANAITMEQALDFWGVVRKFAFGLSVGISFCIVAVGVMVFFAVHLSEILGLMGMFVLAAIGVGLIIASGLRYSGEKKKLDDRPIAIDVRKEASLQVKDYEKSFRIGLVIGICTCILSLLPIFMMEAVFYLPEGVALGAFFGMNAIGVFFIVYSSIIYTNFKRMADGHIFISNEDEPGPRAREYMYGSSSKSLYFFEKIYWPVLILIYFVWSFRFGGWGYSWLIFVAGGVLQDVIKGLFETKK